MRMLMERRKKKVSARKNREWGEENKWEKRQDDSGKRTRWKIIKQ